MSISDRISKIIKHPLSQDLGIPLLGTAINAGINFGMMNYQNKFNARQAEIARQWNQEMDNTKYQRQVADMKAAGVNPALAMDGGVTTQATSNATAQGVTPPYMNIANMANMVQALSQARLNNEQAKNIAADTDLKKAQTGYYGASTTKITAETIGIGINNEFLRTYKELEIKGMELANRLSDARINETNENINKLKSEVKLNIAKAATEEERVRLMLTEEALNKANANRVWALVEYEKNYMAATTEQAKANAKLQLVQAAYQQGLIDEGMIEASVKEKYASANEADAKAKLDEARRILGLPKAEVKNLNSSTFRNYASGVADCSAALDALADVVFKVVGAVATGGASLGIPQPRNPIGFGR